MAWELIDFVGWILWIAVIIIHFAFTFILGNKAKKHATDLDLKFKDNYLIGTVGFFLLHGICRIPYFIDDYYVEPYFTGVEGTSLSDTYWIVGAIIGFTSLVWLLFFVETTIIQKTRHAFTILGAVGAILITIAAFINFTWAKYVQYLFISPLALVIPLFYLYAAVKSTGKVRRDSFIVAFGVLVFELGEVTHTEMLWAVFPPSIYLSPLCMLVGLVMFYLGTIRTHM
ncbi:MAG: hypothetical protein ACTSU5_21280 [Promethearchaeota archaeon]